MKEKTEEDPFIITAAYFIPIVIAIVALRYTLLYDGFPLTNYAMNTITILHEEQPPIVLEYFISFFVLSIALMGISLLVIACFNIFLIIVPFLEKSSDISKITYELTEATTVWGLAVGGMFLVFNPPEGFVELSETSAFGFILVVQVVVFIAVIIYILEIIRPILAPEKDPLM